MAIFNKAREGLSPLFLISNAVVWVCAVIVMGILAFWFSRDEQPEWLVYMLVTVSCPYRSHREHSRVCDGSVADTSLPSPVRLDSRILSRSFLPRGLPRISTALQPHILVSMARYGCFLGLLVLAGPQPTGTCGRGL